MWNTFTISAKFGFNKFSPNPLKDILPWYPLSANSSAMVSHLNCKVEIPVGKYCWVMSWTKDTCPIAQLSSINF